MKKILVIEEDSSIRSDIIALLIKEGYETLEAENGKTGISEAKKFLPDLIISDILMPEANGYEALLELQRDDKTASIPFIFLSALADIPNKKRRIKEGTEDYLVKPYEIKELIIAVNSKLKKKE